MREWSELKPCVEQARACKLWRKWVNAANANTLIEPEVDAIHLSGKSGRDSEMEFRNPNVFMGGVRDYRNTSNITVMLRR